MEGDRSVPPPAPRPCRVCDAARELWASAVAAATPAKTMGPPPTPLPPPLAQSPPVGDDGGGSGQGGGDPSVRRADCLGCRLTGLITGLGGAGYISSRLLDEPPPRGAHRATLIASSAALAALGLARGFGWY